MHLVRECGAGSAFSPACSQQRHTFVETTLRAASAARVADLGCGDCALMVHLAESTAAGTSSCGAPGPLHPPDSCGAAGNMPSFTDVVGVDISLTALVRGRKRLEVIVQASCRRQLDHCRSIVQLTVLQPDVHIVCYNVVLPHQFIMLLVVALHVSL